MKGRGGSKRDGNTTYLWWHAPPATASEVQTTGDELGHPGHGDGNMQRQLQGAES
eukprot:CAMPEP_0206519410 /NCGR_PEP_ID=MMETSP0324_2-20121206/65178_1 /ASSEMBLY_ACC=CAM_ASM_000836 /TAXON_ID=2866 /ORGANISM="Crypthecodinium cohnii, Strain Seligo" /LENGTH=54 /DNA_ID=CAMNT_0054012993 /DNA_START=192 /DNA_END=355 /DNA_ORIENTATION=+